MKWKAIGTIAITAVIVAFSLITTVYSTMTGGVISTTVQTNRSVLVQITTAPTEVDSVFICHTAVGGTDTTFAAQIDTVTVSKTVTAGINPGDRRVFFLLTRDEGKTALSAKDTVQVYGAEIEAQPTTLAMMLLEKVIRAVSWRPGYVPDTLYVNGTATGDSTAVYMPWKNNSITIKATQAGDSVKVMLYTFYGRREMTRTGGTFGFTTSIDSVNISGPGIFGKTLTSNIAAPSMYFSVAGYKGNGKNTNVQIWLNRDRY